MTEIDDLRLRIETLEEQVDILRRAILLTSVGVAPAADWLEKKWDKAGAGEPGAWKGQIG